MSGPTYQVWGRRSGVEWYAKRYYTAKGTIAADYAGPFSTQQEALDWAQGKLDDSEAEEIAEALEYASVSNEDDFTDPVFVTGAVMAQLEDLTPANQLAVLNDIRHQIMDPLWHLQQGHDITIFYPDWTTGYVGWMEDVDTQHGGYAEIVDTKGVEGGETDSAMCRTCGIDLMLTDVLP